MAEVNWQAIREEFESTGATLQELALKYGVSDGTVRSRKCREKWEKKNENGQGCNATMQRNAKQATQRCKDKGDNVATGKAKKSRELVIKIEDVDEELTEMQRLFCWHYIHNFNATQAAIKAGYAVSGAGVEGHRLLINANVRKEIERLKKIRHESILVTPDDIIERYMRIAFADMTDFAEFGRITVPVMSMYGPVMVKNEKTGKKEMLTQEINDVRFKESTEVDGGLICEIKLGKNGTSIKLEDRQKALDWLANFFEMNPMDKHKKWFDQEKLKLEQKKLDQDQGGNQGQRVQIIDNIG